MVWHLQWMATELCRIRSDTVMVPCVVVAHLSRVAVQGLTEVCDIFALMVGLRFCMLLAKAVVPEEMPGVGLPGQVNVTSLLLGQHCAPINHHLAEQIAAATRHGSDLLVSAGVVCWKHGLEGLPSFLNEDIHVKLGGVCMVPDIP